MKRLRLDPNVLNSHEQRYDHSCVPMAIEFTLKLMGVVELDYFRLQDEKGNVSRWGGDYNGKIINNVRVSMEFDIQRGPRFPLQELFDRIKDELDNGRYVNCAWRKDTSQPWHAYVIYGYENDEFLAVTKWNGGGTGYELVDDMKTRLKNIGGSDILTFEFI